MLTITTIDSNIFYKNSLQLLLEQHFKKQKIKVRFTEPDGDFYPSADLIFVAIDYVTTNLLALPFFDCSYTGMIFPILDHENKKTQANSIYSCIENWPIIYRRDTPAVIIGKINQGLSLRNKNITPYAGGIYTQCHICYQYQLAPQENEVIRLIAKEKTLTTISYMLKRSVKTVHSQKKSAMKKLGVNSNFELYTLLRKNSKLFQQHW